VETVRSLQTDSFKCEICYFTVIGTDIHVRSNVHSSPISTAAFDCYYFVCVLEISLLVSSMLQFILSVIEISGSKGTDLYKSR